MTDIEVVIVGGGLAGATAAAMLGRAGVRTVLVDSHPQYPPDLRCEKIDAGQAEILRRTGLADVILRAATFDGDVGDGRKWVAMMGRLIDKRPPGQHGILYHDMVNAMRAAVPSCVRIVAVKAVGLTASEDLQRIVLSDGSEIPARLVVMAQGLGVALKDQVGIGRVVTSRCHSITIAFDVRPKIGRFDFGALTYHPEHTSDRAAYITLFPIGRTMRANLMVYRTVDDPFLREIRRRPESALFELFPNLRRLTGDIEIDGPVRIRPADLYVTEGHRRSGAVLIGDAFATSCPAAGTGTGKVFTDVERLCNIHVPRWLATPGMEHDKIGEFYDDPVKRAYDEISSSWAYRLRAMSTEADLRTRLGRGARFVAGAMVGAACRLGVVPESAETAPQGWIKSIRHRI
jgi:2-polyprenyl-6-methoxyphenol hydroxylase-like FAD-dependent oxidoreductase